MRLGEPSRDVRVHGHQVSAAASASTRSGAPGSSRIVRCRLSSRAVGTLWERRDAAGNGLVRLLGRSRAQLLAHTHSPSTTTQLAACTGLSLGAVSRHLAILRDTGLVTSHRYRREVNYTASDLGIALLERA
jgi:hypothetical protein